MSGSTFTNLRNGSLTGGRQLSDEKMEQVRELLFGEFEKMTDTRLLQLEGRVRELEQSLQTRLDAMQARLDAMSAEIDTTQRAAFDELATGVQDLATRIKRVSDVQK